MGKGRRRLPCTAMLISEIATEDGFDSLRVEWNALVKRLDVPSPFQLWEWHRIWWKHFGSGHRLRILAFREAGELVGVAPFHVRRYGPGNLGPRVFAPLGWEDRQRRQGMTEQNEFILPGAHRPALLAALGTWLNDHRWTLAMLPGMEVPNSLPETLSQKVVLVGKPNWFYHRALPSSWPEFVAGLRKSMRDNVKYYPKLLERRGHRCRFHVSETAATVPAALKVFFDLHRARAGAVSTVVHRDKFACSDRRSFLREVAPLLADLGHLKVGLLEIDDVIAAAQITLEMGDTMFIYYTGYDPAWSNFSVQLVATLECLKQGIERGVKRVEFLRGGVQRDDQRNERWDTAKRVRVNVTLARRPAMASLLLRIPRLRRGLRLRGTTASADILNWRPVR